MFLVYLFKLHLVCIRLLDLVDHINLHKIEKYANVPFVSIDAPIGIPSCNVTNGLSVSALIVKSNALNTSIPECSAAYTPINHP